MADLLEPLSTSEYIVDEILRYGLFIGAVFQAVCIAAAIWLPAREDFEDEAPTSGHGNFGSKGGPVPPPRLKGAKHSGDANSNRKKRR